MAKPAVRTQRYSGSQTVLINATIASATSIDFRNAAGGCLILEDDLSSVTFTFYGCATIDGTFLPLYAYTGVAVTATGPGGNTDCVVEIPPACFGVPFLRIAGNADDGTSITVCIKS